ncbi:FliI/YscN family ATPase [Vibrio cincinnatiensis]|uniref:FliI/YscN family ATPase n=1 Tax=Vibrio cincinnatiensis TaxID=675 RepID=UPI001EDE4E9C|nr:FliI/YscN family ATPase [Vibrio cincinnatiensis]MCG3723699.1 FliI/YscN family ATPase [Vibrio cincinnatiensis]
MFSSLREALSIETFGKKYGHIVRYVGLVVEATGLNVFVGERCRIFCQDSLHYIESEVIGFRDDKTILMPFGRLEGITVNSLVIGLGKQSVINVGRSLIGRIIDAFGNPLDAKGDIPKEAQYPIRRTTTHNPLSRQRITERFETGIKVIDNFLPLGIGQRIGIFAGSGVGKSTLLGMCANRQSQYINVIALIGERGREVTDFIEDRLGEEGLSRSVVIVATSDEPPLVRSHAVFTALAIAEYFCDQGENVLLMLDSMTRFAMSHREIGLAAGEPPTVKGYTPSVFSILPEVVERTGNFKNKGSITGIFTVLVEGDDISEPVTDAMRGILDGHIMLSRKIAAQNRFPAVDILQSNSRVWEYLTDEKEQQQINRIKQVLAEKTAVEELIEIGAYQSGVDSKQDRILAAGWEIEQIFRQKAGEWCDRVKIYQKLEKVLESLDSET